MERSLASLEEGWLNSITWTEAGNLALRIQDYEERTVDVVFRLVAYIKMIAGNPRNHENHREISHREISEFNEIWKLEEIEESSLLKEMIFAENDSIWLRQHFGSGKYEMSQHIHEPERQHHIVLLSDYIHLELICSEFEVKDANPLES